jgi:deoxycytidylate deaminase
MFILRTDKEGNFKNSRPCAHCIEILQKFGIQKVVYSNDHGKFSEEFVDEMKKEDAFISLGWKKLIKKWHHKASI